MKLTDNTLAAFTGGKATDSERMQVLRAVINDRDLADVIDEVRTLDAMPDIQELRDEFNSSIDRFDDFKEHKIDIR